MPKLKSRLESERDEIVLFIVEMAYDKMSLYMELRGKESWKFHLKFKFNSLTNKEKEKNFSTINNIGSWDLVEACADDRDAGNKGKEILWLYLAGIRM